MHRNYILVMGVSCGLVGKQLTALLLTLESLGQFNTTPGEAASPRVLPCWVWQLEYSGVEGPILSKQSALLRLCFVLWDVHHKVSMLFSN